MNLQLVIPTNCLVLQFDEGRNDLDSEMTIDSIKEFIAGNQLPSIIEFTQEVIRGIKNTYTCAYSNVNSLSFMNHDCMLCLLYLFNLQSAQKIFGGEIKQHLLLFLKKTAENYQQMLEDYKAASTEFKGKVC